MQSVLQMPNPQVGAVDSSVDLRRGPVLRQIGVFRRVSCG